MKLILAFLFQRPVCRLGKIKANFDLHAKFVFQRCLKIFFDLICLALVDKRIFKNKGNDIAVNGIVSFSDYIKNNLPFAF